MNIKEKDKLELKKELELQIIPSFTKKTKEESLKQFH